MEMTAVQPLVTTSNSTSNNDEEQQQQQQDALRDGEKIEQPQFHILPRSVRDKLKQPGITAGAGAGFYGDPGVPKILAYNAAGLRSLLAPFLTPHLTVCNSISLWGHHLLVSPSTAVDRALQIKLQRF